MNQKKFNRFLEFLPGFFAWSALLIPIILSYKFPIIVGIFIILFDLYWVFKAVIMGLHLVYGYKLLQAGIATNWQSKLSHIPRNNLSINPDDIYHAVIIATYQEDISILNSSIQSVIESDFNTHKIILVLATEERDRERAAKYAVILSNKYQSKFYQFITTIHPDGIAGEMKAKGANVTWAAKELYKFIVSKNINPENVIVSTADADSRFHSKYFSALIQIDYIAVSSRFRYLLTTFGKHHHLLEFLPLAQRFGK